DDHEPEGAVGSSIDSSPRWAPALADGGERDAVTEVDDLLHVLLITVVAAHPIREKAPNRRAALEDADPHRRHVIDRIGAVEAHFLLDTPTRAAERPRPR